LEHPVCRCQPRSQAWSLLQCLYPCFLAFLCISLLYVFVPPWWHLKLWLPRELLQQRFVLEFSCLWIWLQRRSRIRCTHKKNERGVTHLGHWLGEQTGVWTSLNRPKEKGSLLHLLFAPWLRRDDRKSVRVAVCPTVVMNMGWPMEQGLGSTCRMALRRGKPWAELRECTMTWKDQGCCVKPIFCVLHIFVMIDNVLQV
jgi:hypothetical protein